MQERILVKKNYCNLLKEKPGSQMGLQMWQVQGTQCYVIHRV